MFIKQISFEFFATELDLSFDLLEQWFWKVELLLDFEQILSKTIGSWAEQFPAVASLLIAFAIVLKYFAVPLRNSHMAMVRDTRISVRKQAASAEKQADASKQMADTVQQVWKRVDQQGTKIDEIHAATVKKPANDHDPIAPWKGRQ